MDWGHRPPSFQTPPPEREGGSEPTHPLGTPTHDTQKVVVDDEEGRNN